MLDEIDILLDSPGADGKNTSNGPKSLKICMIAHQYVLKWLVNKPILWSTCKWRLWPHQGRLGGHTLYEAPLIARYVKFKS